MDNAGPDKAFLLNVIGCLILQRQKVVRCVKLFLKNK